MNVATRPLVTDPGLTDAERRGMRDFWEVYERCYDEVRGHLLDALASHPEIAALMESIPPEQQEANDLRSRELSRRAIEDGEWGPYIDYLRDQGPLYAEGGLSFSTWFGILGAFRPLIYPHLMAEFADDRERLLGALLGMDRFLDIAMSVVGEEYLAAKQRVITGQEELVRRLSTSKAVLASIAEGVVTTDVAGTITSVNPTMERLMGWPEPDVLGSPFADAYPMLEGGAQITDARGLLRRAIAAEQVVSSRGFQTTMLTRDGRELPVAVTAAPVHDEDGRLIGGVAVVRDVTNEQTVDRMKSSLISTVSHELRTPLTMIQGFSELIATRDLDRAQVVSAAGQINSSSRRLGRLIDDLLSVSRIEAGRVEVRPEPLDLQDLVAQVVRDVAPDRYVATQMAGVPRVHADADLTVRILTNLLSNAVKYSGPDAPLTVEARLAGADVEVSVVDRGIGIAEDEAARLFTKFYRVDRREVRDERGTGLGLYITKNLVELQGGWIRVESRPGEGSTFTFTLPTAEGGPG